MSDIYDMFKVNATEDIDLDDLYERQVWCETQVEL
jgi:hypothetical protein